MTIVEQISKEIIVAMKAKNKVQLRALRAIKSAFMLEATKDGNSEVTDKIALSAIQKLAKQRKDSLQIFEEQNREDLASIEREELAILQAFLPTQMTEDEVKAVVSEIIKQTGASSMADMGKVMGMSMGKLKGKADGQLISAVVKGLLA